jgi:hypothetical protein
MRRTLSALVLTLFVAGCSALQGSLPYRSGAVEDASGMTVEQYAIGRLGARAPRTACPKAHAASARVRSHSKRCTK